MLKAVSIVNVAVIKELNIEFDKGFSVITGETGAGKSIVIDSIAFMLGSRSSKDMIRTGENRAEVCGLFSELESRKDYFESLGVSPDENGELFLSRYITSDGKTGAKINGKSVSLSVLKNVSKILVSIHGQNDSLLLSEHGELVSLLDGFLKIDSEKEKYREKYYKLCELEGKLSKLKKTLSDKTMMTDILSYQLKEIDSAKLKHVDEEEKLLKLRQKLRNLEKVSKNVSVVTRALTENEKGVTCVYMLEKASSAIRNLSDVFDGAEELAEKLDGYRYEIIDVSERISDILSDEEITDPDRQLDIVEGRLATIKRLKGKYGESISDILEKREEIASKLREIENSDDVLCDLENEVSKTASDAERCADVLTKARKEAAEKLSAQITDILSRLDMPKVRFRIDVLRRSENRDGRFDINGHDDIEYLVSPNIGEEMQPLSKIASGGELSRIMLAIKSTMIKKTAEGTSIFDEIDAGVSGATSERIGLKLVDMAKYTQILCITHSAQIAALANTHFKISKKETGGRVESTVCKLDRDGRIEELSRIIGGISVTDKQRKAAVEMIDNGNINFSF